MMPCMVVISRPGACQAGRGYGGCPTFRNVGRLKACQPANIAESRTLLKAVLSAEKNIAANKAGWTDFKFNDYMEVGGVIVLAPNEEMLPTSYVPPEPPAARRTKKRNALRFLAV